jgi:hypothetical protein
MLQGKSSDGPRWARGQKFTLSTAGTTAEEAYRAAFTGARGGGRSALDAALGAWATPLAVAPTDGVLLAELREKPRGLADLTSALDGAGIAPAEVRLGVDRLQKAGLVELVPLASAQAKADAPAPVPARPAFRW